MKDGRVVVSHDGLSQWHCQVIDDGPESDTNLIMVMTGPDLDPDNIIAWIVEPSEQGPVEKAINPNLMNTSPNNKQEGFYIGPFRILTDST